eukprot:373534_1
MAGYLDHIFKAMVIPKISYGIELWYSAQHPQSNKLRKLVNDIMRSINGGVFSTPLGFQRMILKMGSFDKSVMGKRSVFFSRLIRTPSTNILHDCMEQKWNDIQRRRDNEVIDHWFKDDEKEEKWTLNVILTNKTDPSLYESEDTDEDYVNPHQKKQKKKKQSHTKHIFEQIMDAVVDIGCSDFIYLKGVPFMDIPKRISYDLPPIVRPDSLWNYKDDKESKPIHFSAEWISQNRASWEEKLGDHIDDEDIQLIFPDGSNKKGVGGSGWFSCNYKDYRLIDWEKLRKSHYELRIPFCYGSLPVAHRSSIEHCELIAAEDGVDKLWRYIYDMDEENRPKMIIKAIDSMCVLHWIMGENKITDGIVHDKVKKVVTNLGELGDFVDLIALVHVQGHSDEGGNDAADDMAKSGMYDRYQYRHAFKNCDEFTRDDWVNYSMDAVKGEVKKAVYQSSRREWSDLVRNKASSSSEPIIKWKIRYCVAFKEELKTLTRLEWAILTRLRSNHSELKAQDKTQNIKRCEYCIGEESTYHFMFDCMEFDHLRREMLDKLQEKGQSDLDIDFGLLNREEQLHWMLFPLQDEFYGRKSKEEITNLMKLRIDMIKIVIKYVKSTKRFKLFNTKDWWEF